MDGKNKERRGAFRLRVGDWILLLLALCGIGVGIWYLHGKKEEMGTTVRVTYAIRMPPTEEAWLPPVDEWKTRLGGTVTDETGRRSMGTVLDIELRPQRTLTVKDGEVISLEVLGSVEPIIIVQTEAQMIGERELRIGELRLAAGMTGNFIIGGFLTTNARIHWVEVSR